MKLTTIWTIPAMSLRERFARTGECALLAVARRMPRRLAYWVLIDTGGRHMGNDVVPGCHVHDRAGARGARRRRAMTPEPNAAQLEELDNWIRGVDDRTIEQLKADLRALGDGIHPRSARVLTMPDRIVGVGGVL